MNKRPFLNSFFLISFILFDSESIWSQEIANDFNNNIGKMYVVVGVIVLIFLGLVYFLVRMDRRLKKLEKDIPIIKQ